jgi:Domain of unknown function (DUF5615)
MFLANENFPKPSILLLRDSGFIIKSIQEEFAGISDEEVIALALKDDLIILTFDKDSTKKYTLGTAYKKGLPQTELDGRTMICNTLIVSHTARVLGFCFAG